MADCKSICKMIELWMKQNEMLGSNVSAWEWAKFELD